MKSRALAGVADVDKRLLVGRETRGQDDGLAVGQETMARPVLIHDRQPLDASRLAAGFRDIDDAAIEIGTLAGKPRVEFIRVFVRRAPPIDGPDDKALPTQTGLQQDIISSEETHGG